MLHPEDGDSMDLRNVGILPQHIRCHNPEDFDLRPSFHELRTKKE
jgi:hypothetical protein